MDVIKAIDRFYIQIYGKSEKIYLIVIELEEMSKGKIVDLHINMIKQTSIEDIYIISWLKNYYSLVYIENSIEYIYQLLYGINKLGITKQE